MSGPGEHGYSGEADSVLTKFAQERLHYSTDSFRSRVITYIYLNHAGETLRPFLQAASHMAELNIKIHTFFRNPVKNGESFLIFIILSVVVMGIFSIYAGQSSLGLILLSGALVQTAAIMRRFLADYLENEVQIYIYLELKQIIDSELESLVG